MSTLSFAFSSLAKAHLPPPPSPPPPPNSTPTNCSTKSRSVSVTDDIDSTLSSVGRRGVLSACFGASLGISLAGPSRAAILEADDDEELLERVKKDRQMRLQRQGVISSSNKETGYLQELIYKLSKVGQAIENNDFSAAGSVLGRSTEADWLQNVNVAFTKLSSSPEEKAEVDMFNSSLVSLISSVDKQDIKSSRSAFVTSASALEKWAGLTGLIGQLKGL